MLTLGGLSSQKTLGEPSAIALPHATGSPIRAIPAPFTLTVEAPAAREES